MKFVLFIGLLLLIIGVESIMIFDQEFRLHKMQQELNNAVADMNETLSSLKELECLVATTSDIILAPNENATYGE